MMQAHDAPSELFARFELDTISATREAAFAGRWSRLNSWPSASIMVWKKRCVLSSMP